MEVPKFRIGDVVTLKCSSVKMIVEGLAPQYTSASGSSISYYTVNCLWLDSDGHTCRGNFRTEFLELDEKKGNK